MTGTRVEVQGGDRFTRTTDQAGDRLEDLRPPNATAGDLIAGRAVQLAPRLTGVLAGSIRSEATDDQAVVFAAAPYAGPIHSGVPSRNIEAHPFLTDAATTTEPAWMRGYQRHVDSALDHVRGV